MMRLPGSLPAIIAHRGASHSAPENTLAAVRLAWSERADAVEIDVHLTLDNQVVAIHDSNLLRTAGVDRAVRELTYADLSAYDVGSWRGPDFHGEPVPTLAQVIQLLPPGRRLFIEVKAGPEIVPFLGPALAAVPHDLHQLVFLAIDYDVAEHLKSVETNYETCWVVREPMLRALDERDRPAALIEKLRLAHLDGADVQCCELLDSQLIAALEANGLTSYTWTVDDPAEALRLAETGIHGITTNRPGWLREQCGWQTAAAAG